MRLTKLLVPALIGLLLLGAAGLYLLNLNFSGENSEQQIIAPKLEEKQRFQGLLLNVEKNELNLVYLLSYDPFTENLSAIYLDPEDEIFSPTYASQKQLAELYSALSREQFIAELSQYLELEISFWIQAPRGALIRLVDLLGGLSVNTEFKEFSDGETQENSGQWMDGKMVSNFVSNTYTNLEDRGLRLRHKAFFLALLSQLRSSDHLLKAPETFEQLTGAVQTNLKTTDLREITGALKELKSKNVKFLTAFTTRNDTGQKIEVDRIGRMAPRPIKKIIEESEQQEVVEIRILNGAGIPGLAGSIRNKLQKTSYIDVVEVGNADHFDYDTSVIIDHSNNPQSAQRIKNLLETGKLKFNTSKQLMVDVTLIIGADLQAFVSEKEITTAAENEANSIKPESE